MITRIHSATIIVTDQEASLDFYVNKLGWEKRTDQMMGETFRFLTVAPVGGEAELVLGPAQEYGIAPGTNLVPASPYSPPATGISLEVDDVEATYQGLVDKGVTFTGPLQPMPWGGKATWLIDPDGNGFFFTGR